MVGGWLAGGLVGRRDLLVDGVLVNEMGRALRGWRRIVMRLLCVKMETGPTVVVVVVAAEQ